MALYKDKKDLATNKGRKIYELQSLTTTLVAGTTATTNIAVTGIATEDTLQSVLMQDGTTKAVTNVSSEASITSAGNIQLATTDSTGNTLIVNWYNKR